MKYTIHIASDLSWVLEDDDGDETIVYYDILSNKFKCNCSFASLLNKECKHSRMVKLYIVKGIKEFED